MNTWVTRFTFIAIAFTAILHAAFEDELSSIEATPEEVVKPVYIKVLISENVDGTLLDVRGAYKVFNPENQKLLSSGFRGKRYYLQTNKAGLKWGEGYPGVHQIKIVPSSPDSTVLVDGIQYKGNIETYDINAKIQIVNEVDVEDYLRSVLSQEFACEKHEPAVCDAIAIALRTHVYNTVAHSFNPYWDVRAKDVQYFGEAQTKINDAMEKAVLSTKGMIMTHKELPFSTTWTEHCGGKTASYEAIFRKKGDGPDGVLVGYAQKERADSRWKCTLNNSYLARLLNLEKVESVDVYKDPVSKKVYAIRFNDKKQFNEMSIFEFQKLVGTSRILSTEFNVSLVKDDLFFEGYGKGSGVGICLFTADQMAKNGTSMPQILAEFYPSTHIVKLSKMPESFKKD